MDEIKESYRILVEGGSGEIIEKKSRFIASIQAVNSEEEAVKFIEEIKKKYWDARHNCSAFVVGEKGQLTRCSDDGEPSGTAGRPMLEVLLGEKIYNVCVVVTRYFGGTLLGTGGLVRAYTMAVKEGLKNCQTGIYIQGNLIHIETDYNFIGKVLYQISQKGFETIDSNYGEIIQLSVRVPKQETKKFMDEVTQATNGKANMVIAGTCDFIDKEL